MPIWIVVLIAILCSAAMGGWREDADLRIEKHRKGDFVLRLSAADGQPLKAADVSIRQTRSHFGFGTAVATGILADDPDTRRYRQFILDHFNMITAENAMKWWEVEKERNVLNWQPADDMVRFAQENDLPLRGHNLAWEKQKWTRPWQHTLPEAELKKEIDEYVTAAVGRYKGKIFCWDVLNETLNGDFYTSRLGESIRAHFFKKAHEADPKAALFVNEYSILGMPQRVELYARLVNRLKEMGAPVGGIGVQDHGLQRFNVTDAPPTTRRVRGGMGPNGVQDWTPQGILDSLDRLGELGLPIHLTEVTSITADEQQRARTLDMFFRIAYSHPKVECLILWGFWSKRSFQGAAQALVDDNWNLTPAGRAVFDLILRQWRTNADSRTDDQGQLSFRGFHGRYELSARDATGRQIKAVVDLTPARAAVDAVLR